MLESPFGTDAADISLLSLGKVTLTLTLTLTLARTRARTPTLILTSHLSPLPCP